MAILLNNNSSTANFSIQTTLSLTERFTLFGSTGNVLIQNGGTFTDNGFRLDVNGTQRVQGKLSVNTPTEASAVMEVTSTTQGFLPPRMTTTQKNAIASPAAGLVVYDTTLQSLSNYNGTAWISIGGGGGGSSQVKLASQTLAFGSWTLVGSYYEYTFTNANIVSTGFVTFTPNNASINEVSTCRMLPQVDAASGTCKFYSLFPPQTNIVGEIVIFIL